MENRRSRPPDDDRAPMSKTTDTSDPADQAGWHDYDVSPDGSFAVHTYSSFGKPSRVRRMKLVS